MNKVTVTTLKLLENLIRMSQTLKEGEEVGSEKEGGNIKTNNIQLELSAIVGGIDSSTQNSRLLIVFSDGSVDDYFLVLLPVQFNMANNHFVFSTVLTRHFVSLLEKRKKRIRN